MQTTNFSTNFRVCIAWPAKDTFLSSQKNQRDHECGTNKWQSKTKEKRVFNNALTMRL